MPTLTVYLWFLLFWLVSLPASAAFVYQDFEEGNGTPPSYQAAPGSPAEYGWGFNGAVVGLSADDEPVHQGKRSWKAVIPAGEPVHAGTTIPAQARTYNVNFIPECHDRLTFWVWSDPSTAGDHTVMVKFFDQEKYKAAGIGIWTTEKAAYHQWSQLAILLSQLPEDFNRHRVDKIEFFAYYDGTYYYDDVRLASAGTPEQDAACLKQEHFVSCTVPGQPAPGGMAAAHPMDASPFLGVNNGTEICTSLYGPSGATALTLLETRLRSRAEGLDLIDSSPYGRL